MIRQNSNLIGKVSFNNTRKRENYDSFNSEYKKETDREILQRESFTHLRPRGQHDPMRGDLNITTAPIVSVNRNDPRNGFRENLNTTSGYFQNNNKIQIIPIIERFRNVDLNNRSNLKEYYRELLKTKNENLKHVDILNNKIAEIKAKQKW